MPNIWTPEHRGEIQRDQFVRRLCRTDRVVSGDVVGDCDWTTSNRSTLWIAQIRVASLVVCFCGLHDCARIDIAPR